MIISRKYAKSLIKKGRARYVCESEANSKVEFETHTFINVDRIDLQRTDSYVYQEKKRRKKHA
jgi:hypothetical protein